MTVPRPRVLIVDADFLRQYLGSDDSAEMANAGSSGPRARLDAVLLDHRMARLGSIDVLQRLDAMDEFGSLIMSRVGTRARPSYGRCSPDASR